MRAGALAHLALAAALAMTGWACGSRPSPGFPDLPDLTAFEPSVQKQLREAHTTLAGAAARRALPAEQAAAYGQVGALLLAVHDDSDAEPFLIKAEALAGSDVHWPYYLGHLYRRRGDLDKAARWFERARQLEPSNPATLIWLGRVLVDAGRPDAAEAPLARARELDPHAAAPLSVSGRAALARNDYARAAAYLEDALATVPGATALQYPLAMAYRGLGDAAKAELHLRQRGEVDAAPDDPMMRELNDRIESPVRYGTSGIEALANGRWAEAERAFRAGLALQPADPRLRASLGHDLGTALAMSGNMSAAREQYEEGVRISPTYPKNYYSLGLIAAEAGLDRAAVAYFREAVRLDRDYAAAHNALADALRNDGQAEEALVEYRQVLRIDPRASDARFNGGLALVTIGRFAEAAAMFSEGITSHPDDHRFPHALARVLAAAPDARVRDGRRALGLVQSLAEHEMTVELAETTAMALAEVGRYQEAAVWQRKAISGANRQGAVEASRLMRDDLALYERKQPCRTPWRVRDAALATGQPGSGR